MFLSVNQDIVPVKNFLFQKLHSNNSGFRIPLLNEVEVVVLLNFDFLFLVFVIDDSDKIMEEGNGQKL
jgi:hypothetical protein